MEVPASGSHLFLLSICSTFLKIFLPLIVPNFGVMLHSVA